MLINGDVDQYLELTDDALMFNKIISKRQILDEIIYVLEYENAQPTVKIPLYNLISLKLDYRTGLKGMFPAGLHPQAVLLFICVLNDGTTVSMFFDDIISASGQFEELLQALENKGVYILDPDNIRPALEKDNIYFQEYILKNLPRKDPF